MNFLIALAETLVWLSASLALCGIALRNNCTVLVLLASLLVAEAMQRSGVPFHPVWWAMIDAAAFLLIVRRHMPRRDIAVLALFIPAWCAYLMPEDSGYLLTASVVIVQFLLVVPWRLAWGRAKGIPLNMPCDISKHFDLRGMA